MKGKALFFGIISLLLMSCESKITPVLNFYQAEMHVSDSLQLTITGAPYQNRVWVYATPSRSTPSKSVIAAKLTSDTTAMIYAKEVGDGIVQVVYAKQYLSVGGHSTESLAEILVPVTVVEP